MPITCDVCDQSFRRETIVNHYRTEHPTYLASRIFRFATRSDGSMYVRKTPDLESLYQTIINNPTPLYLDDDEPEGTETEPKPLYIDMATHTGYIKRTTASNKIVEHPDKHKTNWLNDIKTGIDNALLIDIIKFVRMKPESVVDNARIIELTQELKGAEGNRLFWETEWKRIKEECNVDEFNKMRSEKYELQSQLATATERVRILERTIQQNENEVQIAREQRHQRETEEYNCREQVEVEYARKTKVAVAKAVAEAVAERKVKIKELKAGHKKAMAVLQARLTAVDSDSESSSD